MQQRVSFLDKQMDLNCSAHVTPLKTPGPLVKEQVGCSKARFLPTIRKEFKGNIVILKNINAGT